MTALNLKIQMMALAQFREAVQFYFPIMHYGWSGVLRLDRLGGV